MSPYDEALLNAADLLRKRKIAEAEAEYNRFVAAIKLVGSLRVESESSTSQGVLPLMEPIEKPMADPLRGSVAAPVNLWPGLNSATLAAIDDQLAAFTLDDVLGWLGNVFPDRPVKRIDVSKELWRIKEAGKIAVVRRGAGRTPAVFKKP